MYLLTKSNPKLLKGEKYDYMSYGLHLAPNTVSEVMNTCSHSTAECRRYCLNTAGRGKMMRTQAARITKTVFLAKARTEFITTLKTEIALLQKKHKKQKFAIRLNCTSDIPWESKEFGQIPQAFPDVQFYDYTRNPQRVLNTKLANYHLLLSYNGINKNECRKVLKAGKNVAVITTLLTGKLWGYKIHTGDETDLRFLDPSPIIVAVKPKGAAIKTISKSIIRERE